MSRQDDMNDKRDERTDQGLNWPDDKTFDDIDYEMTPEDSSRFEQIHNRAVARLKKRVGKDSRRWSEPVRPTVSRRILVAVLGCLMLGAAILFMLIPQIVHGTQHQVLSICFQNAYNREPVANVGVYAIDGRDQSTGDVLVYSNSTGLATVPLHERPDAHSLGWFRDGRFLGKISLRDRRELPSGTLDVIINDLPEEGRDIYPVDVSSEFNAVTGDILVAVAPGNEPAGVSFIVSQKWPLVFDYGRILNGVYMVEGPADCEFLVSHRIDGEKLFSLDASFDELALIALTKTGDPENRYSAFNRGWAYGHNDKHLSEANSYRIDRTDTGTWLTCRVKPGVEYALIARPCASNDFEFVLVRDFSMPGKYYTGMLGLIERKPKHRGTYELYEVGADQQLVNMTSMPKPYSNLLMANCQFAMPGNEKQDLEHEKPVPYLDPQKYMFRQNDFTIDGDVWVDNRPIEVRVDEMPGEYWIETRQAGVGGYIRWELMGDLDRLDSKPQWDFFADGLVEAMGIEAELLAAQPAIYSVNVILREKCGNVIMLRSSEKLVDDAGFLGIKYGNGMYTPVVSTVNDAPAPTSMMVASPNVAEVSVPLGYSCSNNAGPMFVFKPPERFTGVKLRDIRMVINGSPLNGDCDRLYFALKAEPLADTYIGADGSYHQDEEFKDAHLLKAGNIYENAANDVRNALYKHAKNTQSGAREYIARLLSDGGPTMYATLMREVVGIDPADPPAEEECVARLEAYRDSDRFNVHYLIEKDQQIEMIWDLREGVLKPGGGFLVSMTFETRGFFAGAQWELNAGGKGKQSPRIILTDENGNEYSEYIDYSSIVNP